jgi:hypothetical protein
MLQSTLTSAATATGVAGHRGGMRSRWRPDPVATLGGRHENATHSLRGDRRAVAGRVRPGRAFRAADIRLEGWERPERLLVGGADAAMGGRRLVHGSRELTGIYGTLMGGVPMTARIAIRWTVTLKD